MCYFDEIVLFYVVFCHDMNMCFLQRGIRSIMGFSKNHTSRGKQQNSVRDFQGGKSMKILKYGIILMCASAFLCGGCGARENSIPAETGSVNISDEYTEEQAIQRPQSVPQKEKEITVATADWSDYFEGINGTAVIYDPAENGCRVYNPDLADLRRSPCSTFKIISSLIGLETGVIEPDDSIRKWSGETFWNEAWNKDISFDEAFQASCVWYFREVIDEIGEASIQAELEKLQYGNCDISDWEGRLNTNNSNPSLTGFWIESSLKISPKEQTKIMEQIFGPKSEYSEEAKSLLEQVMLTSEYPESNIFIYGKTGMGKAQGVVVDAWFTGFADVASKRIYFCVYLGESQGMDVSSAKAREIATQIILDLYSETPASAET